MNNEQNDNNRQNNDDALIAAGTNDDVQIMYSSLTMIAIVCAFFLSISIIFMIPILLFILCLMGKGIILKINSKILRNKIPYQWSAIINNFCYLMWFSGFLFFIIILLFTI